MRIAATCPTYLSCLDGQNRTAYVAPAFTHFCRITDNTEVMAARSRLVGDFIRSVLGNAHGALDFPLGDRGIVVPCRLIGTNAARFRDARFWIASGLPAMRLETGPFS